MGVHRILVVEDEKMISDVIKSYLEREGMEVSVASTGAAALSLIPKGFDLVILDLRLPDIDGEREVRRSGRLVPLTGTEFRMLLSGDLFDFQEIRGIQ